jgi:hypothetical protein
MYYGYFRDSKFRKLHKISFKKSKRRLYLNTFLLSLERTACNLLYRTRLVAKIKNMKQIVLNKKLYVNGMCVNGYTYKIKPLDFVFTSIHLRAVTYNDRAFSKLNYHSSTAQKQHYEFLDKSLRSIIKAIIRNRMRPVFKANCNIYLLKLKKKFFFYKRSFLVSNLSICYKFVENYTARL